MRLNKQSICCVVVLLALLSLTTGCGEGAVGSGGGGGSVGGGGGGQGSDPSPVFEDPSYGGSTSAGNPVVFSLEGAKALILTNETPTSTNSNLKKIVGAEIAEIIQFGNYGDSGGSFAENPETGNISERLTLNDAWENDAWENDSLPGVQRFYTGMNGEIVLLLQDGIFLNGQACSFIRIVQGESEYKCVDPNVYWLPELNTPQRQYGIPGGHQTVQFDQTGNVYYYDGWLFYRWNVSDGTVTPLTNKNISTYDYLVSDSGDVWFEGRTSVGGQSFFRRLKQDGSLENVFGDYSIANFYLFDDGLLLASGYNRETQDDNLFEVVFSADEIVSIEGVFDEDIVIGEGQAVTSYSGGNAIDFQRSGSGIIYILENNALIKIYPDEPAYVETRAYSVTFFKIVDEDVYYVGLDEEGRYIFRKMRLGDPETDEDLLGGQNIEIYHFVVVDNLIYFDGLRFLDNVFIVAQIDQNDGNAMRVLPLLAADLLDLGFYGY